MTNMKNNNITTNDNVTVTQETTDAPKNSFTQKELDRLGWRTITGLQIVWNYEKMEGGGYLWAILPALKKIYKNEEEFQTMLKTHSQFFNTTPHVAGLILGADVALEEERGIEAQEAVQGIKTGLMGPFAGVGDTIFGVLVPTIIYAIGAYLAIEGNPMGIILSVIVNLIIVALRVKTVGIGYRQGTKLITESSAALDTITKAATILGVVVVGALTATMIRANVVATAQVGEVALNLQEIFDQILPNLIPAALVGFIYYYLGRKNATSTKAILIVIVLAIVLSFVGFLG